MWQALLAAAVAGSTGLVAKRFFFKPFTPISSDSNNSAECQELSNSFRIGFLDSLDQSDGVFRFCSSGSGGEAEAGSGLIPAPSRNSGVKSRIRIRGLRKKKKGFRRYEIEKRSGSGATSICLKKPRTSMKNDSAASNRGSCYDEPDNSLFSSAIGVCIMYMMSAGKSEIAKLNKAMEENARVVRQLKDQLFIKKSSQNLTAPGSANGITVNTMKFGRKSDQVDLNRSEITSRGSHDTKPTSDDGECPSSVLTEEQPETMEMDQLEMELELELQKLNLAEQDEAMEGYNNGIIDGSETSYQSGGVSASELDKKLTHLLIEQQQRQIDELEVELQTALSKLHEKESELQALKNCVKHFTAFSFSAPSDDEADQDRNLPISLNQMNQTDHDVRKSIIVGMKRPLASSLLV